MKGPISRDRAAALRGGRGGLGRSVLVGLAHLAQSCGSHGEAHPLEAAQRTRVTPFALDRSRAPDNSVRDAEGRGECWSVTEPRLPRACGAEFGGWTSKGGGTSDTGTVAPPPRAQENQVFHSGNA